MDVLIFLSVILVLAILFAMFYVGIYLPTKAEEVAIDAEINRLTDRDEKGRFVRKEPK